MRIRVNPTRMEYLRLRRKVELARRGHKLLKDRLDGLVQKFFSTKKDFLFQYQELESQLVQTFLKSVMSSALSFPQALEQASQTLLATVELYESRNSFSKILPKLMELANLNKTLRILAHQIIETRRRVNALEYILIPELERNLRLIRMKLSELERGARVVLLKISREK